MSEVIDSKVVELKFNNAEFEKNVKTSLTTIEKLKKSLNFDTVTTSMNLLQNAFQLKGLKNIQTQLGQVVGAVDKSVSPIMATINTIGDAITNTIGGAISGVVAQIKSGGMNRAMNVERAKFALQGLGIQWDEISDSISSAVTGTAYGMDAAAKAASVLAGSGIDYKKIIGKDIVDQSEDLTQMGMVLKSVSGVAAQTNQDFEQIAHVFSTIAGNGRLMGMQLTQLSTYGMNAAADIGDALGKTEEEVRDLVSKGKIGADQFFEIMYKKYWANSKKANDTLEGVSRNIKAAYSRIGEAFYGPLIANQGPVVKMLGAYKDVIGVVANRLKAPGTKLKDGEGNKLTTFVTKWLIKDVNLITKFLTDIKNNGDVIKAWRSVYRVLKSGFKIFQMTFNFARSIGQAIKQAFPESFLDYWIDINTHIFNFVNIFYKGSKNIKKNAKTMSKAFEGIRGVLEPIYKNVQNLTDAFKQFFDETFDGIDPLQTIVDTISDLCGYLHVGVIETEDWYNGFKSIWKIVELVYGVFSAFGQAVYETFTEGNFHPIKYFIELLQILTNGLVTNDKTTNRLKNTFKIFTTAVGIVAKVLGIALKIVAQFINWGLKLVGVVLLLTSPIGTLVSKVFELATGFGEAIRNLDLSKYEHLSGLIESIGGFFKTAKDKLFDFAGEISDFASNELGSISLDWPKAFDGVLGALDNIIQKADSIKDKLKNGIGKTLETLKTNIDRAFGKDSRDNMEQSETILERLSKIDILETLGKGIKTVGDVFKDLIDAFKSNKLLTAIGKDIGGFITEITKSLAGSLDMATSDNVMENVKKIFETFGEVLGIVFNTIGQIVDSFSEGVAKYGSSEEVSKTVDNAMEIISGLTLFNWSRSIANISSLVKTGRDPIIKYFNTVASVMESIGKSMIMITFALYIMQQATQQPGWDEARIVLTEYMVLIVAISTFFTQMTKGNAVAGLQVSLKKWKDLKIKKPEFIMSQILSVIIALSVYAIAIAGALKIMSGCDPDTLERNFNLLAGVMILTVVIAGVMAKVTPKLNKNKESVVSMGPLIKSIAVAMLIMALSLSILGKIPFKRLAAGAGALAVLSVVMAAIIYALLALIKSFARTKGGNFSAYSKDGGQNGLGFKIAALAGLVLSIAMAGLIMAQAVAMLGVLPKKVLQKGATALIGLLVVMGLIVGALTLATKKSKLSSAATMGSIAGVILATAGACIVLAIAMAMFSKVPWKGIGRGLAAFAGAMGIVLLVAGAIRVFKLEAAMTSLALTLLSFGAVAIMISASIWLLAKAFIALGKEGPAAVAGAAVLFYSIGKGIGWLIKGLADAVEDILQGVWDICVAIGEFLIEKVPVIVEFLGGLMLDIVNYLVPGSKAAFTKLFDYIFSGENFKLYAGNISEALVKEIQDTRKRIEDENKELTKKFEEADKETDYYSGLWDRLQRITTESGRVKTGYEDEAKELIDELNPALETNLQLQDDIIQNYKDVRDEIDLTLAKKKAEAYTEAYSKQLKEDIEQELVTMQQVREASEALDKTRDDLKTNKDQISAFDAVDKTSKSDLRHWFLDVNEIFDESTGQMVEFSRAKFDSMLDANGNVTEDLIRAAELTQNMLKERTGEIEDQIVKEEGYLEEATENHDDYVNRVARGNELLEVSQTGTAEEIEDAMLKQKYLFKDVNNSTKKELQDQTEAYKKGLDDINKLLKEDPYNANYKKKQEEYLKLLRLAREEERKERGKTTKEIEKDTKESQLAQAETQRQKQDEINQELWKEKKKRIKKAKKEGQDVITAEYEGMDEEVQNLDWTSINSKMEEAGLNSGDYFANGTVDALGTAELMHDFELKGFDLGEMFGGGFVGGIKSKFGEVFNIGILLGQNAESGTKESTKINSPSKVMMQNGKYFVQGFVNGISDSIGSAKKASEKLGEAVVNAFENYDLNADYTPTITPVVDLSNVHSAAGSINSLFGSRSLSLASSAGMISSSMREIQNRDPNEGLISAINGLSGPTNNNVYNVNGITYDDGSNIADAVGQLINAAMIERRM
jgi:tape measure domain-containing protein